jgi:hypothetical protein
MRRVSLGLERAAGEVLVVLESTELGGHLDRDVLVVHDKEPEVDGLVHRLAERTVEVDDRVAAGEREAAAERADICPCSALSTAFGVDGRVFAEQT